MNSSIQKDYYAELGTGGGMGQRERRQEEAEGRAEASVRLEDFLQGGEVKRLIPSPHHSNH